ncbi:MAG: tetratricopeptide repeat protein [Saprospiraceae bacterium]
MKYFIAIFLLGWSGIVLAQRLPVSVRKGDQAMQVADYYTALHYFRQALAQKPSPDVRFRLAEAARSFHAWALAQTHYEILLAEPAAAQFPQARLGLAEALLAQGQYEKAEVALVRFLKTPPEHAPTRLRAEAALQSCRWALAQPPDTVWQLTRLPGRINSPYGEFGAWQSGDTLFYTSYQFDKANDKYTPTRKISKLMFSTDEKRGRQMAKSVNTDTAHTAYMTIAPGQREMYFARCQFTEGAAIQCQLCKRKKDRRGRWEAAFEVLPPSINMPGFTHTQPSLLFDTSTQQLYLLFASNRPGGQGGMDIWAAAIPAKGDIWGNPQPLASINTAFDDITPSFLEKTATLYWATNAPPSFGGYDLWSATYTGHLSFGERTHTGPGLNSSYDEYAPFFKHPDSGYFSSNRPGGRFVDEDSQTCCPDIFKAQRKTTPPRIEITADTLVQFVENTPVVPISSTTEMPSTLEDFLPLTSTSTTTSRNLAPAKQPLPKPIPKPGRATCKGKIPTTNNTRTTAKGRMP